MGSTTQLLCKVYGCIARRFYPPYHVNGPSALIVVPLRAVVAAILVTRQRARVMTQTAILTSDVPCFEAES